MFWNEKIECMSRDELMSLQEERLKKTVNYCYERVPFYKKKFDEMGLEPGDIKHLEDLAKVPFTVKTDLRDEYPFGLQAADNKDIVRFHASSGTTGKPIVSLQTRADLEMWSDCVARCLTMYGITAEDRVQVSYGYSLFTGGLGLHDGAQKVGCNVLPISSGNTQKQIMLMMDLGMTAIGCTPSYALYLSEVLMDKGYTPEQIPLKHGVFGAEPWTDEMRDTLEKRLGIQAHDIYGLTEICGPGVGGDCEYHNGIHIWEDNFIIEVINPKTGEVLPPGSTGEIVFTTITKTGMPILRYRTRDLSRIMIDKCSCGRTMARMDKIVGRSDDMMIIRGVNVFPSQVESVLINLNITAPFFHMVVDRQGILDTVEIQVEVKETTDDIKSLEGIRDKVAAEIKSVVGIAAKITLVEPKSIPRSQGKNKLVTDKRTQVNF